MSDSPFLEVPRSEWIVSNAFAFAVRDRFPVSPGHVLVISRRPVATWFDATPQEQAAIVELVNVVKRYLDDNLQLKPDGYNVGFNAGPAAGQTVMHLHVHIIPRYLGDIDDPRGGVRHVIPGKGNYLREAEPVPDATSQSRHHGRLQLSTGQPSSPLWEQLSWRVLAARHVDILAAFVQMSGLDVIESRVFEALENNAQIRVLVSDYLFITDPRALARLGGWCDSASEGSIDGSFDVRLVEVNKLPSRPESFHPKAWYIKDDQGVLISVGSSNLSQAALQTGIEWNLLSTTLQPTAAHEEFADEFNTLWKLASPLTPELIEQYTQKAQRFRSEHFEPESIDVRETVVPRPWQERALESLQRIRDAGYRRALVAVATGMGKTWLAAFDARQVGENLNRRPRILIVAHRAHILAQAERAVSQVLDEPFGNAKTAWLIGPRSELAGELVVASIQKLSRPEWVERLAAEEFDYVVIDEVHHAHAPTYRKVLARIQAGFILGLTATPERTDGVDVASIFDDNLAYHATIGDGIAEDSLVPFHYIGIKDTVDFRQIPWRNCRFDLDELERRVLKSERMERLWVTLQVHPAERTILFCCSRRHAVFARDWLRDRGVTAAAVFSGGGDPCGESLNQLQRGQLQALCVVDMFNEGLDIPAVDRVVMLRPTESKTVFIQQLGRGLRASQGKSRLIVIDFVGNHRIFAQRLIHLLSLRGGSAGWQELSEWLKGKPANLPDGCLLDVEVAAREMLKHFIPKGAQRGIEAYRALREELGRRPTPAELTSRDYLPRTISAAHEHWFDFVASEGDLNEQERQALAEFHDWLRTVETTKLNKSYKMVVLRVLLDQGGLLDEVDLSTFCRQCRNFMRDHPVLRHDLEGERHAIDHVTADDDSWEEWWTNWPIDRWLDAQNGRKWFRKEGKRFIFAHSCESQLRAVVEAMTAELVDWRLAAYAKGRGLLGRTGDDSQFVAKVSHAGGRPILFVPDTSQHPGRPVGPTVVFHPDGTQWEFKFVKIACNVAKPVGQTGNQLPSLLRSWFGADAGLPGTDCQVSFENADGKWYARPLSGDTSLSARSVDTTSSPHQAKSISIESNIDAAAQYVTHVPVYDLRAAAGRWGPDGVPETRGWVRISNEKLSSGMFAAQVFGRSMEPKIHDGDWCLFERARHGSRQNCLLLLQVNTQMDPENGGRYTVKRYTSTKNVDADGSQQESIELQPLNNEYPVIRISSQGAGDLRILGEFVRVI